MNETFQQIVVRVLRMPAHYFYLAWATGFCLILLLLYRNHLPELPVQYGPGNASSRFQTEPEPLATTVNHYQQLLSQAPETTKIEVNIATQLAQLETYLTRSILGEMPTRPDWFSDDFTGSGIDRKKFARRFSANPIFVQRWQKSSTSPTFVGADALERLISTCFAPWKKSNDFRIELQAYGTKIDSNQLKLNVAFECYGQISYANGRQGTGIWSTSWIRLPDGSLHLSSLEVLAQEEVAIVIDGGKLFQDCTASILGRCASLNEQLLPGLDDWARKIPNLDIVGNQGLVVGDVNQDGLDDLYLCQGHGLPNLLLIQNPDGTTDDVSQSAGVDFLDQSFAALMVDLDNDRDQDLVVTTDDGLLLLANNGKGEFKLEGSLPIGRGAESLAAADFDQDGDLDLFLCKQQVLEKTKDLVQLPKDWKNLADGGRNVLLRNDEGWQFHDVTEQAGITINNSEHTRCAVWLDYDLDGDQDLYLTNEFSTDRLLRNDQGWFSDVSQSMNFNLTARHRTVSTGDFNQDGRLDFFVGTDSSLQIPNVPAIVEATETDESDLLVKLKQNFSAESQIWFSVAPIAAATVTSPNPDLSTAKFRYRPFLMRAPIFDCQSANGSCAADFNNDGLDDLVVANGFLTRSTTDDVGPFMFNKVFSNQADDAAPLKSRIARGLRDALDVCRTGFSFSGNQRNRCFLSIGKLGFANVSAASGLDLLDDARAVATTDWDQDGDVDVVMTCRSSPQLRIFRNRSDVKNGFVSFDLTGTKSNRDAIGTRIELYVGESKIPLVKMLQAGSGYLSQSSKRLQFGLGTHQEIRAAVVTWPDGSQQRFEKLVRNARYRIVEGRKEMAEKSNDRFSLAINTKTVDSLTAQPATERMLFYPKTAIPRLLFRGAEGKFFPLGSIDDEPMLAVFFGADSNSLEKVRGMGHLGAKISEAKLDCIALYCDPEQTDLSRSWSRATSLISSQKFPFRWGLLTPASIQKLIFCAGHWFGDQQLPQLPFGLLLDSTGLVIGYYPAEKLNAKTVIPDVALLSASESVYRKSSSPRSGRWAARYRYPELSRLGIRLAEVGFPDDADELLKYELPVQAYVLCHRAIEQTARGENEIAKSMLEKAIELNPNCTPAFVGVGHLLAKLAHDDPDLDAEQIAKLQSQAIQDYEYALQLDPLNAEAIFGRVGVAIEQNRIDDALKLLLEYAEIAPEPAEVDAMIGRLYFTKNQFSDAAKYLVRAFENRPTLPNVAGDLGLVYLNGAHYKTARKFLILANRLQPSDRDIIRFLAETEFLTGNYESAVDLLQTVIQWEPNRQRPKMILAWMLATCPFDSIRSSEKCLQIIQPLLDFDEERSPALMEIHAAGLAEAGQFEEALNIQQQALKKLEDQQERFFYSDTQKEGLVARRELYRRQRPYRLAEPEKNPIRPPGDAGPDK